MFMTFLSIGRLLNAILFFEILTYQPIQYIENIGSFFMLSWSNSKSHHLSMKEGNLFVLFVSMRSTEPGCFRLCSWSLWKALEEERCISLVPYVWTCSAKVLEYSMISSLKIKLNCSWKFQRNWNVPLVLLERSWLSKI